LLALILWFAASAGVSFCVDEKEKAATDAATEWLMLVDSGQYAESWFQSASAFRYRISKELWKNAMDTARAPLGKIQARQLKSATYTTSIPNAPSGEYVVVLYETSFERVPGMIETPFRTAYRTYSSIPS
jgi:hypothetical protein